MPKKKLPKEIRDYFKKKGSQGGKIGGPKRMESMTVEQRRDLAKKAAAARWGKKKGTA
jgi:hypothetical protein